jgi:hypothetical protein
MTLLGRTSVESVSTTSILGQAHRDTGRLTLRLCIVDKDSGEGCKINMAGCLNLHVELLYLSMSHRCDNTPIHCGVWSVLAHHLTRLGIRLQDRVMQKHLESFEHRLAQFSVGIRCHGQQRPKQLRQRW